MGCFGSRAIGEPNRNVPKPALSANDEILNTHPTASTSKNTSNSLEQQNAHAGRITSFRGRALSDEEEEALTQVGRVLTNTALETDNEAADDEKRMNSSSPSDSDSLHKQRGAEEQDVPAPATHMDQGRDQGQEQEQGRGQDQDQEAPTSELTYSAAVFPPVEHTLSSTVNNMDSEGDNSPSRETRPSLIARIQAFRDQTRAGKHIDTSSSDEMDTSDDDDADSASDSLSDDSNLKPGGIRIDVTAKRSSGSSRKEPPKALRIPTGDSNKSPSPSPIDSPLTPTIAHRILKRKLRGERWGSGSFSDISSQPGLDRQGTIETFQVNIGKDELGFKHVNQYLIGEKVGSGSYSQVRRVVDEKTNMEFAMKIMKKSSFTRKKFSDVSLPPSDQNDWKAMKREIAIMKKLQHDNIVALHEVIDDEDNDTVFLIMELMDRTVMPDKRHNPPLDDDTSWQYFRDLIQALEYLHFQRIVHRDIKPSNLLVTPENRIKVGDFGTSVQRSLRGSNSELFKIRGTPAFKSPEELDDSKTDFPAHNIDIWASGITLYMFTYGTPPFWSHDNVTFDDAIKNDPINFPGDPIDPQLQDLITKLLQKDYTKRIQISDIKKHPWVTRNGTQPMPDLDPNTPRVEVSARDISNAWVVLLKMKHRIKKLKIKLRAKRALQAGAKSQTVERNLSDLSGVPDLPDPVEYSVDDPATDAEVSKNPSPTP